MLDSMRRYKAGVFQALAHPTRVAIVENLTHGELSVGQLCERVGVERSTAYDVFSSSVIAAPFVHYKREAFEHPGQPPVAFSLDLVAKDLDLILALAAQAGATMEQATTNHRVVEAAVAAGLGDHDLSELTTYLRRTPDSA